MPKLKPKSAAKKRFQVTGTGKIVRKHAYKNHILTKKSKKRKKALVGLTTLDPTNVKAVKEMLHV